MTTQIGDGVWVSSVDAEEFAPDPEVGGMTHVLRESEGLQCGIWWSPEDLEAPESFEFPHDETIVVLEGEVEIQIEAGPTLNLKPGSIASFRKGVRSTWLPSPGFKEFWVYSG